MKMMNLPLRVRLGLLCLVLLTFLPGHSCQGAPLPAVDRLRTSLLHDQWMWDGRHQAFPPVPMEFREDGRGGTTRFTYEWTITGPKTVTLKMQNRGREMTFTMAFNEALTSFEGEEVGGSARTGGYRRETPGTPAPTTVRREILPLPPVAASPSTPTPSVAPVPVMSAPVRQVAPTTPPPMTTALATTPRPITPPPRATPAPVSGLFHVYIDDTINLFLNSREILSVQNRFQVARSREVTLKPGDHLVARLANVGGPRAFIIAFASSDQRQVIHFGNMNFRILPRPDANDFTLDEFKTARLSEQDHTRKEKPPFPFKTRSEWIWGKNEGCTIGATITAEMFQQLQR